MAIPEAVSTSSSGFLTLADRPIIAALVNSVKQIGHFFGFLENGFIYLKNIVIGTPANPEGITMYDKVTGDPYCIVVENGFLKNLQGICGDTVPEDLAPVGGEQTESTETATTTPEIEGTETATTTPTEEEVIPEEEPVVEEPVPVEEETVPEEEPVVEPTPEPVVEPTPEPIPEPEV
jgi:hypothetical protein